MFLHILSFELNKAFRNKSTYIYFAVMFSLAFLFMNVAGGAIGSVKIAVAGDNFTINSPNVLNIILSAFSFIGVFISAALVNSIVYKEYRYNSLPLTFTTRIGKFDFLAGRFAAILIINILIILGPALGLIVASYMPFLDKALIGEVNIAAYFSTYYTLIIPNLVFLVAIFFSLTVLLRSITVNWLAILGFYTLYIIGMKLVRDLDNQTIASLLDPFGMASSFKVQTSFSMEEARTNSVPLENVFLFNRILWTGIGFVTLIFTYFRFNFSYDIRTISLRKKKTSKTNNDIKDLKKNVNIIRFQKFIPDFGKSYSLNVFFKMFKMEFISLIKNPYLILIMAIGLGFLIFASTSIGKMYDTATYPVTYNVIDILGRSFNLFILIITILFSGNMIWQARNLKVNEIENTLPVKNWHFLASKMMALTSLIFTILCGLVVTGIIIQASKGYYNFEIGLYIKSVLGLQFTSYLYFIVLAFFVQILINNRFLAYLIMIIYYVWESRFAGAALQNNLFIYGGEPGYMYSDMNGFTEGMWVVLLYRFYWLTFAAMLTVVANKLYMRTTEEGFSVRWKNFKTSFSSVSMMISVLWSIFILTGGFIYYNTNILHKPLTSKAREERSVDFEKTYKKYENMAQPKITSVDASYDLYPENSNANISATYSLKNKTNEPIDTLILSVDRDHMKSLNVENGITSVIEDKDNSFFMYKLNTPLMPQDSISMSFSMEYKTEGFSKSGVNVVAHKNGTFINSSMLPSIGYNNGAELSSKRTRAKYDLGEKTYENSRFDKSAIYNNFISDDADFIQLSLKISTSGDQTALAPGYCKKTWEKDGRNYYHYVSDIPVINYFAILSAEYELAVDRWIPEDTTKKPVDIKIFYHKEHDYNLNSFIEGVKASLKYYSENFCHYPHPELKIAEFPRWANFAQSFPGLIPFSEGIGFIADLRDKDKEELMKDMKIDYPFWVTSHEMAHQWLAHHITAADTEGSQMLMEALTQFSSLKVAEERFGKERIRKILRKEMNTYVMSRKSENLHENPLATVWKHQQNIYYRKGTIVLNAINEYLGDDKLVKLIGEFIRKYKFKSNPYPTTANFIEELRAISPDSLQYMITDWLEKISFYNFDIKDAKYKRKKLEYFVTLEIEANKSYSDKNGKETETSMDEYVEVGIFNSRGKEVALEKVKLKSGKNTIKLKLGRKPANVIVDPYYKLISKDILKRSVKVERVKE